MSQTISVDLSPVIRGLEVVNDNVARVNQQVLVVSQQGEQTRSRLEQFYQEFVAYVTADALRTELQLAETRLVKVRQELDQRFGHYSDVRRRVTGILQATDVAIVRQETMHTATEGLTLAAPRYWLAPSLVALTAWISDNQPLAERALAGSESRRQQDGPLLCADLPTREAHACPAPLARTLFPAPEPAGARPRGDRHARCRVERRLREHGPGGLPPGQLGMDPGAGTGRELPRRTAPPLVRSP